MSDGNCTVVPWLADFRAPRANVFQAVSHWLAHWGPVINDTAYVPWRRLLAFHDVYVCPVFSTQRCLELTLLAEQHAWQARQALWLFSTIVGLCVASVLFLAVHCATRIAAYDQYVNPYWQRRPGAPLPPAPAAIAAARDGNWTDVARRQLSALFRGLQRPQVAPAPDL
jgi:hypothetical protein